MHSCVRSQELCARIMIMEDAYQVKITLQSRAPNGDSNSLTIYKQILIIFVLQRLLDLERNIQPLIIYSYYIQF